MVGLNAPTIARTIGGAFGSQLEYGHKSVARRAGDDVKLDDLRALAMEMSRRALEDYPRLPPALQGQLTLGTYFEATETIFELYLPGETPSDAIVLVRVAMDKRTGDGTVEIREENWRRLELLPRAGGLPPVVKL
jgi:hypothetical protein